MIGSIFRLYYFTVFLTKERVRYGAKRKRGSEVMSQSWISGRGNNC